MRSTSWQALAALVNTMPTTDCRLARRGFGRRSCRSTVVAETGVARAKKGRPSVSYEGETGDPASWRRARPSGRPGRRRSSLASDCRDPESLSSVAGSLSHPDGMWITLHLLLSLDWLSERADKQRPTHALPRAERTHDMEGQQMAALGEGSQRMSITNKPKKVKGPSESTDSGGRC
jgi:hypothetical protein